MTALEEFESELMALGRKYKIVSIVNSLNATNDSMVENFKQGVHQAAVLYADARVEAFATSFKTAGFDGLWTSDEWHIICEQVDEHLKAAKHQEGR